MKDYIEKRECVIHSLNGGLAEATILKRTGDNQYIAQYGEVKCAAIYNLFTGRYYCDDVYGVISRGGKERGRAR